MIGSYHTSDQKIFDHFIRIHLKPGEAPSQWYNRFTDISSYLTESSWRSKSENQVHWRRLPNLFNTNIGNLLFNNII